MPQRAASDTASAFPLLTLPLSACALRAGLQGLRPASQILLVKFVPQNEGRKMMMDAPKRTRWCRRDQSTAAAPSLALRFGLIDGCVERQMELNRVGAFPRPGRLIRSRAPDSLEPGDIRQVAIRRARAATALPRWGNGIGQRQVDASHNSGSCHRTGQPVRLTRCSTQKRSPISPGFARVDAMKRPITDNRRAFLAGSASAGRYNSAARRSRPSPAEIEAFPSRKRRPRNPDTH